MTVQAARKVRRAVHEKPCRLCQPCQPRKLTGVQDAARGTASSDKMLRCPVQCWTISEQAADASQTAVSGRLPCMMMHHHQPPELLHTLPGGVVVRSSICPWLVWNVVCAQAAPVNDRKSANAHAELVLQIYSRPRQGPIRSTWALQPEGEELTRTDAGKLSAWCWPTDELVDTVLLDEMLSPCLQGCSNLMGIQ